MSDSDLMKQSQQIHDLKKELRQKNKMIAVIGNDLKAAHDYIVSMGNRYNECTRSATGKICDSCECPKKGDL